MCAISVLLALRQRGAFLLSRESVQTQEIDDQFLWLDTLLFGMELAKASLDPTEFFSDLPSSNSNLLPLVIEGYNLEINKHTEDEEEIRFWADTLGEASSEPAPNTPDIG